MLQSSIPANPESWKLWIHDNYGCWVFEEISTNKRACRQLTRCVTPERCHETIADEEPTSRY